jgi:hypothetical protein
MPNRLIREGILKSDRVEQLDFPAEVFYRRLMSVVDDHGLYDARPSILRTSLYPLRVDRVREADIARWIAACEKAGVIALYEHGGKPYLQMLDTRWQVRSEPKYPLPPDGIVKTLQATDNSCSQPITTAHLDGDGVGDDTVAKATDVGANDRMDCPYERIAKAWNSVCLSMPAVKPVAEWNPERRTACRSRWNDKAALKKYATVDAGVAYWTRLFGVIQESDFLAGRAGEWCADFDWVMKPKNLIKIIEGKYVNREPEAVPA